MMQKDNKQLGKQANKQYYSRIKRIILSSIIAVLAYAFVLTMVLTEIMPPTYDINVDKEAEETIYAIAEVVDDEATNRARERAANSVANVYKRDDNLSASQREYFEEVVFLGLKTVSAYGYSLKHQSSGDAQIIPSTETVQGYADNELSFLKTTANTVIRDKVILVLSFNPTDVANLEEWFKPVLETEFLAGISDVNLDEVITRLEFKISETEVVKDINLKGLFTEIIRQKVQPNSVIDKEATDKARVKASEAVKPVTKKIGDEIVVKGQVVTQNQFDMLKELGMLKEGGIFYRLALGSAGLVLVMFLMVALLVRQKESEVLRKSKNLLLMCLLVAINIGISVIFKSIGWPMMMNTTMCAILLAMFFGGSVAFVVNSVLSVIMALLVSSASDLFGIDAIAILVSSFVGGGVAIFYCRKANVSSYGKMLLPGIFAGLASMVSMFLVLIIAGKNIQNAAISSLYSLAGGVVAALLSTGSVSIWENVFKILTPAKLFELSNASLVRQISAEIPGTYQHSLIVSEMAEAAAAQIGANAALARTASLYHDIGKLRTPECFTENQTEESKNFHNTITPFESTQMIFSHLSDGVQIAKANKLPKEIIDIIIQHHGTSLVSYFYNKAREADATVDSERFRYPGPKPQTKEAGIILLADCIEASVRSLDNKEPDAIRAQIEKMVSARLADGELDECDLSMKDIKKIKESFLFTLSATHHERIKYQGQEKDEHRNSRRNQKHAK